MCKYSIVSNDSYAEIAVSAMLNKILLNKVNGEFNHINILIITDCPLYDVYQIYRNLAQEKSYILISSAPIFNILSQICAYAFVDIRMSLECMANKLFYLMKNHESFLSYYSSIKVDSINILYKNERLVLKYILQGKGVTSTARITGIGLKMVSAKKMRIMKKLNVSSIQQLYIKFKCIELSQV